MKRAISGRTQLCGVIGSPVRHSMSPVIYNAAFEHASIDAVFVAMPVAAGQAAAAIEAMRTTGVLGLSVTMPHKFDVIAACDHISDRAQRLQSVNCVYRAAASRNANGGAVDDIVGDSTDGAGFVAGLRAELGIELAGTHCVVLGAGGAARAVILAAAEAGAGRVTVINRSPDRAAQAAVLAGDAGKVGSPDDLATADVVVNSTPLGMAGTDQAQNMAFDPSLLRDDAVVSDLIYHPLETPLLAACRSAGVACQNGVAMLVHQAVVQYEHFTGQPAPIEAMTAAANAVVAERASGQISDS